MPVSHMVVIQAVVVALSAALGAALAVLHHLQPTAEKPRAPRTEIPAIWLGR
jgi:hypothetical protein